MTKSKVKIDHGISSQWCQHPKLPKCNRRKSSHLIFYIRFQKAIPFVQGQVSERNYGQMLKIVQKYLKLADSSQVRNDRSHVGSKEPSGPCRVNHDISFIVNADKKINFDHYGDMAWVEHEKTLSCFEFVVSSKDPTDESKKCHSFLKSRRQLFFDSVTKVIFPLEEEDKEEERQNNDKSSVVKEWNFQITFEPSIFSDIGFQNSSNHVFVQNFKESVDFHESFRLKVQSMQTERKGIQEFIILNSVINRQGGLQYSIIILCQVGFDYSLNHNLYYFYQPNFIQITLKFILLHSSTHSHCFKQLRISFRSIIQNKNNLLSASNKKMSHNKLSAKEWENFSNQISFSKQTVEQLSKLYIIIHQKVKSSIKKCVLDPKKSFSSQAHHHLQFIKSILDKIKDTRNDQYLAQIQVDLLAKYQKNFLSLLNQIQIMLKVEQSQTNLNIAQLKSIKPQKRQKHDLKSEVAQSTKRITRAKSGYKIRQSQPQITINPKTSRKNHQNQSLASFMATKIDDTTTKKAIKLDISNQTDLQTAFQKKQEAIGSKIQNSMSKTSNGLGVSFQKKYENNYLEMYFNQRKEFADLIFNQEVYNQIIHNNQEESKELDRSDSKSPSKILKMQQINTRLFPQFHIKTKFMKPGVKSKISNLITQIKKQLLQLYFAQNLETLKAVNEKQKQKLNEKKKITVSNLNTRSQSISGFNRRSSLQTIKQTYQKNIPFKNQGHKFSQTQYKTNFNGSPPKISKSQTVHLLNKKLIFAPQIKKSFINPNPKPFYQTEKWNQQIEKKYENRIMAKFLHAKI